jgi:hypothetical protein
MRNISGNIFADEFFGSLSQTHRLLWIGLLINLADDQGRMMDNVALMRSLLFPYDDVTTRDIEKGLALFVAKHKIIRYAVGTNGSSKHLIQITNWWKYQHMQWAARSMYPAPENWTDRIRAHEKGGIIVTENWDKSGGYVEATKRLPRRKVTSTNPLPRRDDDDDDKGRGRGRAGALPELIKSAQKKNKTAPPLSNFGKGKPKGFANLKAEKAHGN